MKTTHMMLMLFLGIAGISCAPMMQVHNDYDKNINFADYKTFTMYKLEQQSQTISQLNAERIIKAVKAEMVQKGFTEKATGADLMVNAVVILKDKKQVTAYTDYYGYGGMYRPYMGGGMGTTTYDVSNYTDGSLIIDVIDAKTQRLIWQGIGNKEIDGPIQDPDTKIPQAVKMIMAGFPPTPANKK